MKIEHTLRDHLLEPDVLNCIVDDLEPQGLHHRLHGLLLELFLLLLRYQGPPLRGYLLQLSLQVCNNEVYCRGVITPERYNNVRIAHGRLDVLIIGSLDEAIVLVEDTLYGPSSLAAVSQHYTHLSR